MKHAIIIALLIFSTAVHAEVSIDTDKGNTTFRVKGQTVDSVDAVKAAVAGELVFRCKPKSATGKKIFYSSGSALDEVVECTPVELKINPKTGAPKWSVIK